MEENLGIGEFKEQGPVKVGTAFYDRGRCLPWGMETPCVVCEEVCPVSPKAIETYDEVITRVDGVKVTLNKPFIIPERCIGCGICEKECPVLDERAVYVTAVGETRFRNQSDRRLLLNDKDKQAAIDLPGEERVSLNASLLSGAALLANPSSTKSSKKGGCSSGGCSSGSCGTSKPANTVKQSNSSCGCSGGSCSTSKPTNFVQLTPKTNKSINLANNQNPTATKLTNVPSHKLSDEPKQTSLRQLFASLGAALQSGGCGSGCGCSSSGYSTKEALKTSSKQNSGSASSSCSSGGCGTKKLETSKILPKSLPVPIVPTNFVQSAEKSVKLEIRPTPKSLSIHEDFDLVAWVKDLNDKKGQ
jgi:Pyruvate/2-oxoacid:ferredoxin oxidoreductase delta subunit